MATDLSILQDQVKRDPKGYYQDFLQQFKHFQTQFEIFQLKPSKDHKEFSNLVKFLSHVAPSYPEELKEFPTQISNLLDQSALVLSPDLRKVLVRALILMRNRNLLSPTSLLSLFFKLFRCPDKSLRELLRNHIINDIARCNSKKKDNELNRTLQNFMYSMLQDASGVATRESLTVMIELYNKNIWKDKKTVNVISQGIFVDDVKVMSLTLRFFLSAKGKIKKGGDDDESDSEEDEEPLTKKQVNKKYNKQGVARMTKKKKRLLKKKLSEAEKKRKEKEKDDTEDVRQYNHGALMMINDPQGYAEKVFGVLKKTTQSFDVKVALMNLISRLVNAHQLFLHSFYSFMMKYTQPHQQHITQLLAILAQSVHHLITPDVIEPVILHIANTFVTDRRPNEVIAIGLNTIREICTRSPHVMNKSLLKDLTMYRKNKDKGIMMASRSLIQLFRAVNPSLLPKSERGKGTDINVKPLQYGEEVIKKGVEGAELLEKFGDVDIDELDLGDDSDDDDDEDEDGEGEDSWEVVTDGDGELEDGDEDKSNNVDDDDDDDGGFVFVDSDGEVWGEDDGEEIRVEGEGDEEENEGGEVEGEDGEGGEDGEEGEKDGEEEGEEGENDEDEDNMEDVVEEDADSTVSRDPSERIDTTKILTDEDWEKLRYLKEHEKELLPKEKKKKGKKRKWEEIGTPTPDDDVDESSIIGWQKRARASYDERMDSIKAGREERKYIHGRKRVGGSKTNIEKRKNKPFAMLKHKAKKKLQRSSKQQRNVKSKHLKLIHRQKLNHVH
eukprot:TRINITY_DN11113_c0_g1_i1.p1 TRINITY_DN11113_c0_g1~~TRINITY_DN11113_c0_g1_i1.p1  ORF type:complete len:781 (-),score=305.58 TRINITY_DN11113_c0_g1_i1:26-2368(-)